MSETKPLGIGRREPAVPGAKGSPSWHGISWRLFESVADQKKPKKPREVIVVTLRSSKTEATQKKDGSERSATTGTFPREGSLLQ
jgi:hypothetical protein